MIRYVGLDVHKRIIEVCIIAEDGSVRHRQRLESFDRARLASFAQTVLSPEDRVAIEATTNTWAVVEVLRPFVAEVVPSNPLLTKLIAQAKVKTDKVDALVLAQLLRCDFLPRIWVPDLQTQEWRRWTRRRAALVGDRTALKNRLHSVLAQRLLVPPVAALFGIKGLEWLRTVELDVEGRWMLDSDLRQLQSVSKELADLDSRLARLGYDDARVKVFVTLPGVDVAVAMGVLAAWGDVRRFADGDRAAAYLGLVPRTKQSADRCYHGPITKAGNGKARWLLIQAAQHLRLHPGPLGVFFRRLKQRKNHNVAVVATARKLAVIAWRMLMKNEPYRYAASKSTEAKLQKLRVKATGQRKKGGSPKGVKSQPKVAAGVRTRTVKPLARVYEAEGVPPLGPVPAGEAKTVTRTETRDYVASLEQEHVCLQKQKGAAAAVPTPDAAAPAPSPA